MQIRVSFILLVLATLVLVLPATLAAQAGKSDSSSRLDALVTGAMKSADQRFVRAEKAITKSTKHRRGTAKWFSLYNLAKTNYRVAYKSLDRFKRAKISEEVKARLVKMLADATARLVDTYRVLIDEYVAAGSRKTAARLVSALERVSPKDAAKLKAKVAKDVHGRKPKIGDVGAGPTYNPRTRAGRRLTGEEARYLGRRGYRPPRSGGNRATPKPSAPRPNNRPPPSRGGAPRGGSVGRGGR